MQLLLITCIMLVFSANSILLSFEKKTESNETSKREVYQLTRTNRKRGLARELIVLRAAAKPSVPARELCPVPESDEVRVPIGRSRSESASDHDSDVELHRSLSNNLSRLTDIQTQQTNLQEIYADFGKRVYRDITWTKRIAFAFGVVNVAYTVIFTNWEPISHALGIRHHGSSNSTTT